MFKTIFSFPIPIGNNNRDCINTKINEFDKNATRENSIHDFWLEKQSLTLYKIL